MSAEQRQIVEKGWFDWYVMPVHNRPTPVLMEQFSRFSLFPLLLAGGLMIALAAVLQFAKSEGEVRQSTYVSMYVAGGFLLASYGSSLVVHYGPQMGRRARTGSIVENVFGLGAVAAVVTAASVVFGRDTGGYDLLALESPAFWLSLICLPFVIQFYMTSLNARDQLGVESPMYLMMHSAFHTWIGLAAIFMTLAVYEVANGDCPRSRTPNPMP